VDQWEHLVDSTTKRNTFRTKRQCLQVRQSKVARGEGVKTTRRKEGKGTKRTKGNSESTEISREKRNVVAGHSCSLASHSSPLRTQHDFSLDAAEFVHCVARARWRRVAARAPSRCGCLPLRGPATPPRPAQPGSALTVPKSALSDKVLRACLLCLRCVLKGGCVLVRC